MAIKFNLLCLLTKQLFNAVEFDKLITESMTQDDERVFTDDELKASDDTYEYILLLRVLLTEVLKFRPQPFKR